MVTRSRKTIASNPLDDILSKAKPATKVARAEKTVRASKAPSPADTPAPALATKTETAAKRSTKTTTGATAKKATKSTTDAVTKKATKTKSAAASLKHSVQLEPQSEVSRTQKVVSPVKSTVPVTSGGATSAARQSTTGLQAPELSAGETAEQLMAAELAQGSPATSNREEEIVAHPCTPVKVLVQPGSPQSQATPGVGAVAPLLTAEDVFQTELTRVHADIKQEVSRSKRAALKIVTRWSRWSVAASVIPAPFIDMAAISGVQVKMIYALCKQYEVDFEHKAAIAIASGVTGGAAVQTIAGVLAKQMVRTMPGIGTVFMFAVEPVISYATTYALGLAFISHFEADGRLHDFNPETIRQYLAAQIDKRKSAFDSKVKPEHV